MSTLRRNIFGTVTTVSALAALVCLVLGRAPSGAQDAPSEPDVAGPCPEQMVHVPGATFQMGASHGEADERPVHSVKTSSFCIDRTEVTVAAYQRCVASEGCRPAQTDDSDHTADDDSEFNSSRRVDQHPINGVSWDDAQSFCGWRGSRLPTEAEWEYAARGTDGRVYPWGYERPSRQNNFVPGVECQLAICGHTQSVGRHPAGASPFGALDMAGHLWEWVADWYGPYPAGAERDPSGPATGTHRVLRGGGLSVSRPAVFRAANRSRGPQTSRSLSVGFRCAQSARVADPP